MDAWDLNSIETPAGTRDPVVLETADGARAILIALAPGQELGDHEVRERAWIAVVDGDARIASRDGDAIEGGVGTLATFEPGERHSVSSESGARILLLLAPWPGAGHYPAEKRELSADA